MTFVECPPAITELQKLQCGTEAKSAQSKNLMHQKVQESPPLVFSAWIPKSDPRGVIFGGGCNITQPLTSAAQIMNPPCCTPDLAEKPQFLSKTAHFGSNDRYQNCRGINQSVEMCKQKKLFIFGDIFKLEKKSMCPKIIYSPWSPNVGCPNNICLSYIIWGGCLPKPPTLDDQNI